MNTISREYWFSAAHRIEGHPKCGRLHGHNYRVVVSVTGAVDRAGMVLDYGVMDQILKPLVDKLDHFYIVSDDNASRMDPVADLANKMGWAVRVSIAFSTAECIAYYLHNEVQRQLADQGYRLDVCIEVDETPKSTATYA